MSSQQIGDTLVWIAAPPTTLLPVLYWVTARWWQSLTGWALMISKIGLALLVDLSLAFRIFGPNYSHRSDFLIFAFAIITVGSYLYLITFLLIQRDAWRAWRYLQDDLEDNLDPGDSVRD